MIRFTVPAVPVAQPRQRHRAFVANGRTIVGNYTPASHPVTAFKASVRQAAHEAYQGPPMEGPLRLTVSFVMPRPKGMMWKKREMPRVPHTKKPDADNLAKAVKDALSKQCWRDDCQVCCLWVDKWIAAGDEQPHVSVEIQELGATP